MGPGEDKRINVVRGVVRDNHVTSIFAKIRRISGKLDGKHALSGKLDGRGVKWPLTTAVTTYSVRWRQSPVRIR